MIITPETGQGTMLLTREQTAAMLGIKPHTLAVWASTKRYPLQYVKVGRSVRYRHSDIDAFIASRTQEVSYEV